MLLCGSVVVSQGMVVWARPRTHESVCAKERTTRIIVLEEISPKMFTLCCTTSKWAGVSSFNAHLDHKDDYIHLHVL